MARFNDHIDQTKRNLLFLEQVNNHSNNNFDWQVTVCFYSALHLINAHLSTFNLQYRKHKDVKDVLNPYTMSPAKLPEEEYKSYIKLQSLSRRSRYLVNEKDGNLSDDNAYLTYSVHLGKALKHLDSLILFFTNKYALRIDSINIKCEGLKSIDFKK